MLTSSPLMSTTTEYSIPNSGCPVPSLATRKSSTMPSFVRRFIVFWNALPKEIQDRNPLQFPSSTQLRIKHIYIFGMLADRLRCFGLCGPHQCSADTGADTWKRQAFYHMPGWPILAEQVQTRLQLHICPFFCLLASVTFNNLLVFLPRLSALCR